MKKTENRMIQNEGGQMSKEELLKKRWEGKEKLISKLIGLLQINDDSWPSLLKDIKFVDEAKNRRDLRGIPLVGKDLRSIAFRDTDLRYSDLRGADLCGADFETADLRGSRLDDVKVDESTDWGTYFAWFIEKRKKSQSKIKYILTQLIFRYFGYKGKIYSERIARGKEDFREVLKIYRALRIAYKSVDSTAADYYYYRENHCGIVSLYPWWHPIKWLGFLWEKLSCSGTAPLRTLFLLLMFILICAFIYYYIPSGIVRESEKIILGFNNFGEALYFSIITFTSLGYGDFHPNLDSSGGQILKYICSLEAIVGVISIALFAAIFFRFMSKE